MKIEPVRLDLTYDHIVARHAESTANAAGIIQGNGGSYGLSNYGHSQARKFAHFARENYKHLSAIRTSSSKRSLETGRVISDTLNLPIVIDPSIIEMDCGILAGKSKSNIPIDLTDAYSIWRARGDLDGIEGAEIGDKLQARVIAFLDHLRCDASGPELIISHAGFMRCLINTHIGRERTHAIDCQHVRPHILPSKSQVTIEKQSRARSSDVCVVKIKNKKYVLKKPYEIDTQLSRSGAMSNAILEALKSDRYASPICLYDSHFNSKQVKIYEYVEGKHVDAEISEQQSVALVLATWEFFKKLQTAFRRNPKHAKNIPTIVEQVAIDLDRPLPFHIQNWGEEILTQLKHYYGGNQHQYFANLDLHRSNLLFQDQRVGFIDLENYAKGPRELQFASLLSAAFLLEHPDRVLLHNLISLWPEKISLEKLIPLIKARAFRGLAFFANRQVSGLCQPGDHEILERYLRLKSFLCES